MSELGMVLGYPDGTLVGGGRIPNDLISRSALKQDLLKRGFWPVIVKHAVEEAPTIDAVPVVRCCKCEYSWYRSAEPYSRYCKHTGQNVGDNDFCSYGERRIDESG